MIIYLIDLISSCSLTEVKESLWKALFWKLFTNTKLYELSVEIM